MYCTIPARVQCTPPLPLCLLTLHARPWIMTTTSKKLAWSFQFSVISSTKTSHLRNDKIILPSFALKKLFSIVIFIVFRVRHPQTSIFDLFNFYSFAAEREARSEFVKRQQHLSHFLIFRLINSSNERVIYAEIREFSANDRKIGLNFFFRHFLRIQDSDKFDENQASAQMFEGERQSLSKKFLTIIVHVKELPKGTFVRLRPLKIDYDVKD